MRHPARDVAAVRFVITVERAAQRRFFVQDHEQMRDQQKQGDVGEQFDRFVAAPMYIGLRT